MTVVIRGASMTLAHVPSLVPYGSKPARDIAADPSGEHSQRLAAAARVHAAAVAYPPNRAFVGALAPEDLWDLERPHWHAEPNGAVPRGRFGEVLDEAAFYGLLRSVDQFDLVRLDPAFAERALASGALPLRHGGELVGAARADHDLDDSLKADVLLENLAAKATGVLALRRLIADMDLDPDSIDYALGCGEEAIGDRYQRGGGNLAKAVAERCRLDEATGSDVKAFCCGPNHAVALAGALVQSGVINQVIVVGGCSLAKLGMKAEGHLDKGMPILEDLLAGFAILVAPDDGDSPILRLDALGRHAVKAQSSQRAILEALVSEPLRKLGLRFDQVDRYATELHNPEVTEPVGSGNVPLTNYKMIGGLAVLAGQLSTSEIPAFIETHGMPGFAPTQGHVASAVPYLAQAVDGLRSGALRTTLFLAKGSLFLGRMTQMSDGLSFVLERNGSAGG
jgi:glycine/sarcosine/betaine reductase complex component C subunit beta